MKHLKKFNTINSFNSWVNSTKYVTPYVSKINNQIRYRKLPYDARIEYIEGDGTQWIDTGVIPTLTTISQIKVYHISSNAIIYGYVPDIENADRYDYRLFINHSYGHLFFDTPDNNRCQINSMGNYNEMYELELGNNYIKDLTNNTILGSTSKYKTNPACSIKLNYTRDNEISSNRWYYVKIYDNNTLLLDLIPVRKDGVGYMYDTISKRFFGNQGTGEFILGPDI